MKHGLVMGSVMDIGIGIFPNKKMKEKWKRVLHIRLGELHEFKKQQYQILETMGSHIHNLFCSQHEIQKITWCATCCMDWIRRQELSSNSRVSFKTR